MVMAPDKLPGESLPDVLDIPAASELLNIHPVTLRKLAALGDVPARKVGREWRFSRPGLHAWLAADATPRTHPEEREPGNAPLPRPVSRDAAASLVLTGKRNGGRPPSTEVKGSLDYGVWVMPLKRGKRSP